eukprot:1083010-Rhodomonas_salina.1
MLMPPATIGIDAVSVVFICMGSLPWLGLGPAVPPVEGSVSRALMTMSTKMLFLHRTRPRQPRHSRDRAREKERKRGRGAGQEESNKGRKQQWVEHGSMGAWEHGSCGRREN